MGSDLFESYVGSIISAVTVASFAVMTSAETATFSETTAALFPLVISAVGIIASVIGIQMCIRDRVLITGPVMTEVNDETKLWLDN